MTPTLQHRNGTLFLDNGQLISNAVAETYLTAEAASGGSTITVKNITSLAVNQIFLIEELGTENAEIILTHASSAPSGTTVTLASNLVKTHPAGSRVRVIMYNQVELKRGTTTVAGDATALTVATTANFNPPSSLGSGLVAIDPTVKVMAMESSEHTSGYYFARYKNSITSDFSGYTDALEYGGWDANTVGYMIESALRDLSLSLSEKITVNDCFRWLNEGMREFKGKRKRFPEHYKDNQIIGQAARGTNIVSMPADIYDTETNKSLIGLRIGKGRNLRYLDPSAFDAEMDRVSVTQVRTQASAADTTLEVDNSYDFEDSGSVSVYISGTKHTYTYTGVTRSATAGILTGIPASGDGAITVTTPVDAYVWQDEVEGIPYCYTVRNGQIEYWYLPDSSEDNQNVYADYNAVATSVDSLGDTIDAQRYDVLEPYLKWRMDCKDKLNGKLDPQSAWFLQYKERLNDAMRTMDQGRVFGMAPKLNTMRRRGGDTYDWVQSLTD